MDITAYLQTILSVLHDSGVAAGPIFGLMWWLERSERLSNKKEQKELNAKRDEALNEVKIALETLASLFNVNRRVRR